MSTEVDDIPDLTPAPGFEPLEAASDVAPVSDLAKLHGTLFRAMLNRIKSGKATAAEWSAAAKFLADNEVNSKVGVNHKADELRKRLAENQNRTRGAIPAAAIQAAQDRLDRELGS